jgi:hypothetical protein
VEDIIPPGFQANDLVFVSGPVTSFPFKIIKIGHSPGKEGLMYTLTPNIENWDIEIRVSEKDLHREEDNEFEGMTEAEIQKTAWKMFFEKALRGLKQYIESYDASSLITEARNADTDGAKVSGVVFHYASDGERKKSTGCYSFTRMTLQICTNAPRSSTNSTEDTRSERRGGDIVGGVT